MEQDGYLPYCMSTSLVVSHFVQYHTIFLGCSPRLSLMPIKSRRPSGVLLNHNPHPAHLILTDNPPLGPSYHSPLGHGDRRVRDSLILSQL